MKTYETTATFVKTYSVTARNAEHAASLLEDLIDEDSFHFDQAPDYQLPEDEPVTCPACEGDGIDKNCLLSADECPNCPRCDGEGIITPDEYFDDMATYTNKYP